MKIVIPFSILLLLVGLLSGCVREETIPGAGTGRMFNVSYKIDAPQTRAAATGAESEVKDVAVFFYNADESDPNRETYVGCQAVTVPEGSGSSGSFPLPLPTAITPGMKYKLIVIGNYNTYRPEGKSLKEYAELYNTRTYTKMQQEIQAQLATDGARVTTPLPFWGRLLGKDGNETVLTGPAPTDTGLGVSVKFSRAVARIDVTNLAADRLRIAWVKVCNYRSRGYFFNESMTAGDIVRGTSVVAPGATLPSGYVQAPPSYPSPDTPGSLRQDLNGGGLYAFHNSMSYTAQDDKATTCLLIAGYYQDPTETAPNTAKLTYYRANVSDNGSSQFLRRNYLYTVTINSVKKAGAETEDGSMNETEQLLDYAVGDNWESGNGETVPGEDGNFLTLSATSVILDSDAGSSDRIKVIVKDGASWEVKWKDNDNYFRTERAGNSISLFTVSKNETNSTRNATLTVSVTGLSKPLELAVSVTQLSSANDLRMLLVQGKQGAFDYPVPGQGDEISLQVITGGPDSQWKAEADNDLLRCVSTYTPNGVNKGYINLSFMANAGAPRQGKLTVTRMLSDGVTEDKTVPPVTVTFKQVVSPYLVSVVPNYTNGLTVQGFQPERGTDNGIATRVQFIVILADPANYKFTATCSFNSASDAYINDSPNEDYSNVAGPLQTSKTNPSTLEGINGDNIWMHVFRTGPGDADIQGSLLVKAVPTDANSRLPEASYSIPITIHTNCRIGDSKLGTARWADRNVGTLPLGTGGSLLGLNYSNDENSDDYKNNGFRGTYYYAADAPAACETFGIANNYEGDLATGWRVPTKDEVDVAVSRMRSSKQRAYIVSDDTSEGTVGCWFPLSGTANSPSVDGSYWSSTSYSSNSYYYLSIDRNGGSGTNTSYANQSIGQSVRCVHR